LPWQTVRQRIPDIPQSERINTADRVIPDVRIEVGPAAQTCGIGV
jgi:hypothetical protein